MWKLSSNNPSVAYWEFKLKVDLTDIWSHQTYKSSMLPQIVPTVALVHPRNAYKVYFFLGQHIFCVNLKKKKLMQCLELDNQELPSLSSLVVHSWNLPAGTTKIHSSGTCFMGCRLVGSTGVIFLWATAIPGLPLPPIIFSAIWPSDPLTLIIRKERPDESHAPGVHFLVHYNSVDGFLEKAVAVISRSRPELFGMGLDELEEDEDHSLTMEESDDGDDSEMEQLEEGGNDCEMTEESEED
ncbi:hypothetical protein CFC21_011636 [Triticum aestivum]|uniref:Uncharacterized protein n=2 Tax=Triticum aestivum TaxID=4565 RepID=A0A3B5ZV83_WHEAT|nr:hypothetical protein CFC21_011636 [Triticum aestivum]